MALAIMTKEDKKWRAESDAYTLMSAMQIEEDEERLSMALDVMDALIDEKSNSLDAAKAAKKRYLK